jgi:thiol-disulfide isomerase/thioredoxin
MSGILFLGNDDFQIRQGDQGLLLSLTYDSNGLTLVLFYSKECPYCDSLINKFKQLPSLMNGCQFAMVNVNRNMSVVERSKNTIAPISYVPDVILYVNGMPYIRYDGPHDINHIKDFIVSIYQKVQKTAFMGGQSEGAPQGQDQGPPQGFESPEPQKPPQDVIPAYTIGKPTYGDWKKDGVCYLNFQNAYVSTA